MFCEKRYNMIIWFLGLIISSSLCRQKFDMSMFSHIFNSFTKNGIIHQLKKIFFKIFVFFLKSVYISLYGFSLAFWLNLITLWTLFKTNLWFNACFNFLMCITCPVLSCKSAASFSTLSVFILSGKKDKSLWC